MSEPASQLAPTGRLRVAVHAVDLLRAEKCEIEAVARTKSTLEEVFMRTVDGK